VCKPSHPYNVLLDVAMTLHTNGIPTKQVCFAFQCREWAQATLEHNNRLPDALKKWRNRNTHLDSETEQMSAFRETNTFVWVWVAPSLTGNLASFVLEENEAVLTLDGLRRWCPSLQFAGSAIACGTFRDQGDK
jgi:hypothetical protein